MLSSHSKINTIIGQLRQEKYRWTPARRTYIKKKNGKLRPLGMPTWSDKLLQEVIRLILEAYYEPTFSDNSHGFRPQRGCHTALHTSSPSKRERNKVVYRGRHKRLLLHNRSYDFARHITPKLPRQSLHPPDQRSS